MCTHLFKDIQVPVFSKVVIPSFVKLLSFLSEKIIILPQDAHKKRK